MTLTHAQAEALYDLLETWRDGTFTPREAFPARNNADNGKRRVCRTLARKGLLVEVSVPEVERPYRDHIWEAGRAFRYRLADSAIEAFQAYAEKMDYEFGWRC